jgi:hypothetical protein
MSLKLKKHLVLEIPNEISSSGIEEKYVLTLDIFDDIFLINYF